MKHYYTIAIVALAVLALALGGLIIFQKNKASQKKEVLQSSSGETEKKEFAISVDENTQIFGIAKENPYYGEPPASTTVGGDGLQPTSVSNLFEIFGDVISVDPNKKTIRISSDYPRPINTAFTPRGPKVSLKDIKEGDRIVASGAYDEKGEAGYNNIQFIQITPSLEEIKRLREAQGK